MSDDFFEDDGLLDDDPALDFILYEEMEKDQKEPKGNGGCLGVLVLFLLPCASTVFWLI